MATNNTKPSESAPLHLQHLNCKITSVLTKTYVNCVKFISKDYLLASSGNLLQVYHIESNKLVNCIEIFSKQRIHGIIIKDKITSLFEYEVLIFGGENVALVNISINENVVELDILIQWTINYWIQDASFFDNNHYAILASSNIIYLYFLTNDKSIKFIKSANCKEISVLYSAKILGSNWDDTVILCGTVFSQVTVWSPVTNDCDIIHRLLGHHGVIFSVTYHQTLQTICSTSDDRSIRIWQVDMPDKKSYVDNWMNSKICLKYSIYGHTARVWRNLQLNNGKVISIGEDGQLRVWLDGKCLNSWNTHQNGNVWCIDYNEEAKLIATGGGDCGICLWPLCDEHLKEPQELNIKIKLDDFPRQVLVVEDDKLLLITNNGEFIIYKDESKTIFQHDCFKSYCVLALNSNRKFVSAASIRGDIYIIDINTENIIHNFKIGEEKIFSFHWLDENKFVICTKDGTLSIYQFFKNECKFINKFILPKCKERWLTAAVISEGLFICGDRDGSIHVFRKEEYPIQTFHKVHSRLGVSCIEFVYNKSNRIVSIGRDGFLKHWEIKDTINNLENRVKPILNQISSDKLPIEWPAKIIIQPKDILIIGFNEINLIIWSVIDQKIIFKLKCGGGHRSWDIYINDSTLYFSFIKQKHVYKFYIDLNKTTKPALVQNYHRSEINAMKIIQIQNKCPIFISGGEDNTIRLSQLVLNNKPLNSISLCESVFPNTKELCPSHYEITLNTFLILRSHISSVRCLNYTTVNDEIYIVSGGGRAQLKIWKLNLNQINFKKNVDQNINFKENEIHQNLSFKKDEIVENLDFKPNEINKKLDFQVNEIVQSLNFKENEVNKSLYFEKDEINRNLNLKPNKEVSNMGLVEDITKDLDFAEGEIAENLDFKPNEINKSLYFKTNEINRNLNFNETGRFKNLNKILEQELFDTDDVTCTEIYSDMLNGIDKKDKFWKLNKSRINPETRYMDVCLYNLNEILYIATACSDGYVRIFTYCINNNNIFNLIKELNYHKKCVLKINIINYNKQILLLSMATDGYLIIWNFNKIINENKIETDIEGNSNKLNTDCHKDSTELSNEIELENTNTLEKEHKYISNNPIDSDIKNPDKNEDEIMQVLNKSNSNERCNNTVVKDREVNTKEVTIENDFESLKTSTKSVEIKEELKESQSNERFNETKEENLTHEDELILFKIKIHQSGINSFDIKIINNYLYICTGGDDCTINLLIISNKFKIINKLTQLRAHDSQITGINIINNNMIISSSIDQKVILWKWDEKVLIKYNVYHSCIPDIHGLDRVNDNYFCIYGCGIEIINTNLAGS